MTGANGQLGTEIREVSAGSRNRYLFSDVISYPGAETLHLDITNQDAVRLVCESEQVDVIVNCAGYTNVDKAEDEPAMAELLNSVAVGNLAKVSADRGATSSTFPRTMCSRETDRTLPGGLVDFPLGVYGSTKLSVKRRLRNRAGSILFRTRTWLSFSRQEFREDDPATDGGTSFDQGGFRSDRNADLCPRPC